MSSMMNDSPKNRYSDNHVYRKGFHKSLFSLSFVSFDRMNECPTLMQREIIDSDCRTVSVDYSNESSVMAALKDQQLLIITLPATATSNIHSKNVQAVAKAGEPHIMPNVFSLDDSNEDFSKGKPVVNSDYKSMLAEIEAVGCS